MSFGVKRVRGFTMSLPVVFFATTNTSRLSYHRQNTMSQSADSFLLCPLCSARSVLAGRDCSSEWYHRSTCRHHAGHVSGQGMSRSCQRRGDGYATSSLMTASWRCYMSAPSLQQDDHRARCKHTGPSSTQCVHRTTPTTWCLTWWASSACTASSAADHCTWS